MALDTDEGAVQGEVDTVEGAEAEAPEPVETEVAEGDEPEPGDLPAETDETPETTDEPTAPPAPDAILRELEELKAERARVAPLLEFAQRALAQQQAAAQQPVPPAPSGPDPVDEAFRLLWEPADTEEAQQERAAQFKALPPAVRREAASRFQEAQQAELERVRNPAAYYAKQIQPLVQQAVQKALQDGPAGQAIRDAALARFDAAHPDLANDAGYEAVGALMRERIPLERAVEIVRLRRAVAQAGAANGAAPKSKAAEADARAVLEARRGKAAGKPERAAGLKPIKRSGYSIEDAQRDVEEALRGE